MIEQIKKFGSHCYDMALKGSDGLASHTKFFSFLAQLTIIGISIFSVYSGHTIQLAAWISLGGLTANRSLLNVIQMVWSNKSDK